MTIDLQTARAFLAAHGRVLDRVRLDLHLGDGDARAVLRALDAYRNPDGGYGWGLEPDLRARESQPAAAMHALEVMAEAAASHDTPARDLCDWLARHTLADGGLPFALPIESPAACAPFWAAADPTVSSLMMTAQVAANAYRVGRYDRSVAEHPWLARASAYCTSAIASLDGAPHAYELLFAIRFLDAAAGAGVEISALLDQLGSHLPPDGRLHVEGGSDDETLHALDLSPDPAGPSRRLFSDEVVAADRSRLEQLQQPDGGWTVDFASYSPAAALEWRGYTTVAAITTLLADDART
jgi:hypothetical protein